MLSAAHIGVHIQEGLVSDATRIAVLASQVWLHTYATDGITDDIAQYVSRELSPQRYKALLSDPKIHMLVAQQGPSLVGFAVIGFGTQCPTETNSTVELQTLYVQEHFTGKGIGKLLLQSARAIAHKQAHCALWLTVNAKNKGAIAFYASQGYTQIGTTQFILGEARHENLVLISPTPG